MPGAQRNRLVRTRLAEGEVICLTISDNETESPRPDTKSSWNGSTDEEVQLITLTPSHEDQASRAEVEAARPPRPRHPVPAESSVVIVSDEEPSQPDGLNRGSHLFGGFNFVQI